MTGHDDQSGVHALSGAYAVDALDPEERARFEEHLGRCAECRAEVDSLRDTAAALAGDAAIDPPSGLRDRVLEGIEEVRPLPPVTPVGPVTPITTPRSPRSPRRRSRAFLLAAAAVLVALLVGGAVTWRPWTDDEPPQLTATERIIEADDAVRATEQLADGAEATLVVSRSHGGAVIITDGMAPAPAGKVYELWLQDTAGDFVSAGLMPDEQDATVLLDGDPRDATAVGITVEPDGGSPQPTTEPIALLDLPG